MNPLRLLPHAILHFLTPPERRIVSAILFVFVAFLAGCTQSPAPSTTERPRTGSVSGYSPADSAAASRASEAPQSRPGLGTGWGEERNSSVSRTSFVRANGNRPAAVDTVYYNDREGIDAMLAHEGGGSRRTGGLMSAARGLVSVGVRNSSGDWLDGWLANGRRFIAGERGDRYEIVVRNKTRDRLEIVLSVDGLDVMDGRAASFAKRGYIVYGGDTLTVDGFRTSSETVAAFRFSSVSRSYAALKHGDTRNVGVIGIAAFTEDNPEVWRRKGANPFPGSRWATPPE